MEYEFYIDLFFLSTFFFNVLALMLTAVFLRQNLVPVRIGLSAAIGSFWNCFLIVAPVFSDGVELLLTLAGVGSLMVWCAFPQGFFFPRGVSKTEGPAAGIRFIWNTVKQYLRADVTLWIASALVNGCFSFAMEQFYLSGGEALWFAGALCGFVYQILRMSLKQRKIGAGRYRVRLHYQGLQRDFLALADSGNRLRVPETGKPVVLIAYQDCKEFCDHVSGGFFIPYRAVGTEQGLLFAMTFEKMEIIRNGQVHIIEQPTVAITKEGLSAKGDFNMILPEEYVPGE